MCGFDLSSFPIILQALLVRTSSWVSCNLCACSTSGVLHKQHCNGDHGYCTVETCSDEKCYGAKCECTQVGDRKWGGRKCELGSITVHSTTKLHHSCSHAVPAM